MCSTWHGRFERAISSRNSFRNSPWSGRLSVTAVDVRQLFFQDKYDLVICNPPFFTNSLLGPDRGRNLARHGLSLSLPELLQTLELSLEPEGIASLLLPPVEHQRWAELLDSEGWHIVSQLQIVPVSGRLPNRIISICSRSGNELQAEEQLVIREETGRYTEAFTSLMAPFYLNL